MYSVVSNTGQPTVSKRHPHKNKLFTLDDANAIVSSILGDSIEDDSPSVFNSSKQINKKQETISLPEILHEFIDLDLAWLDDESECDDQMNEENITEQVIESKEQEITEGHNDSGFLLIPAETSCFLPKHALSSSKSLSNQLARQLSFEDDRIPSQLPAPKSPLIERYDLWRFDSLMKKVQIEHDWSTLSESFLSKLEMSQDLEKSVLQIIPTDFLLTSAAISESWNSLSSQEEKSIRCLHFVKKEIQSCLESCVNKLLHRESLMEREILPELRKVALIWEKERERLGNLLQITVHAQAEAEGILAMYETDAKSGEEQDFLKDEHENDQLMPPILESGSAQRLSKQQVLVGLKSSIDREQSKNDKKKSAKRKWLKGEHINATSVAIAMLRDYAKKAHRSSCGFWMEFCRLIPANGTIPGEEGWYIRDKRQKLDFDALDKLTQSGQREESAESKLVDHDLEHVSVWILEYWRLSDGKWRPENVVSELPLGSIALGCTVEGESGWYTGGGGLANGVAQWWERNNVQINVKSHSQPEKKKNKSKSKSKKDAKREEELLETTTIVPRWVMTHQESKTKVELELRCAAEIHMLLGILIESAELELQQLKSEIMV